MDDLLPLSRLKEILAAARALRVGVVGDFALQGAWLADPTRAELLPVGQSINPRPVVQERYSCAAAANVAVNLAALELAEVRAFTILGDDWRGDLLLRALHQAGVEASDALTWAGWSTPFTGRVLLGDRSSNQEDARLDFVNSAELALESEEALLSRLEESLPDLDALVVADYYLNGVISPGVRDGLNDMALRFEKTVFLVDSRARIGLFQGMMRKSNEREAARWLFPERDPSAIQLADFAEAALYPQVDCGCPLFINMQDHGCLVLANGESHLAPRGNGSAVNIMEGGDAFLAALAAGLAARANPVEAARLGSLAEAAVMAGERSQLSASPQDILAAAQADNFSKG